MGEKRLQSEFSGDVNYLTRLNSLFYTCDNASLTLDVYTWYHTLMVLYRELHPEMKGGEAGEGDAIMKKLKEQVNSYLNNCRRGRIEVSSDLYENLHSFEIFIRKVLKSSGLHLRMKEDARKALR